MGVRPRGAPRPGPPSPSPTVLMLGAVRFRSFLKGTPFDPRFVPPERDDRDADGGVPVGGVPGNGMPGGEWSVGGDTGGGPAGAGDDVAGSGVLADELLRIAGRLAVAALPDSPALCLFEAETLVRARDLVTSALAAR